MLTCIINLAILKQQYNVIPR